MGRPVSAGTIGLAFCALVTAALLLLKAFGAISISWWVVFLPLAIGAAVMAVALAGVFTMFVRLGDE